MSNKKNPYVLPLGYTGPFTQKYLEAEQLLLMDKKKAYQLFLNLVLLTTKQKSEQEEAEEHLSDDESENNEDPIRVKEAAVYTLGKNQIEEGLIDEAKLTFKLIRPFFSAIPKARTARIVRNYIDLLSTLPNAEALQEELCLETIEWSKQEKRTFLRLRVETRLALLYFNLKRYAQSLSLIEELLKEVKKLDDKLLLVEIQYIEAKVYYSIKNLPKAKAALTAARSSTNAIHCPPFLQADIDVLGGALHLEESDPKTAYSYFVESFEAFHLGGDQAKALSAFKYAMLAKILSEQAHEISSMVLQKQYLNYSGRATDVFMQVAKSHQNRDLKMFEQCLQNNKDELESDPIISRYISKIYQTLLEQNLLKVLQPYSRVELSYIAERINLPLETIQEKLSQMLLDKQLAGTLDQGSGILQLFDEEKISSVYGDSMAVFENLSSVVDILHSKAQVVL